MSSRGRGSGGAAGAALTTVILFALVVVMAGHGILWFGRTQRWIAAADGARWVADEGRRAALTFVAAAGDSLPPGGSRDTPWGTVEVREMGPELRLLRTRPGPASPGTGWATLPAAPSPVVRAGDRSGAARVGGGVFDTDAFAGGPDPRCPEGLDGVSTARVGPLPGEPGEPRLGVLEFEDLLSVLPGLEGGRLDLPAGGDEGCNDVRGFGDPERPGSCPDLWGAGSTRGDLTVSGWGQGILAVAGDLVLAADARFRGGVWVGGSLRVGPGAELRGLADVARHLQVDPGGTFMPDECSGARALEDARPLRIPRRVGPAAWPLLHR